MRYDLSGQATLEVDGEDGGLVEYLRSAMDPYRSSTAEVGEPDVTLRRVGRTSPRFLDIQNPATDGIVTASDGERLFVVQLGRSCTVGDPLGSGPAEFAYESGFPVSRIFKTLVRPALQVAMHRHRATAIHAAAVDIAGAGLVVGGWSESGKTETALALMEAGGEFISDKWTILTPDRTIAPFPVGVGIRRWVLPYLPHLRARLPPRARAQLALAGVAAAASAPLRRTRSRGATGAVIDVAERTVALADRASLSPSELRELYGPTDGEVRRVPLRTLVVLTTVPGPEVRAAAVEPSWAATRLARTGGYERRGYFAISDRRRYAFPRADYDGMEAFVERDAALIRAAISDIRVLDVRAPFPTDPRRVADAITAVL